MDEKNKDEYKKIHDDYKNLVIKNYYNLFSDKKQLECDISISFNRNLKKLYVMYGG